MVTLAAVLGSGAGGRTLGLGVGRHVGPGRRPPSPALHPAVSLRGGRDPETSSCKVPLAPNRSALEPFLLWHPVDVLGLRSAGPHVGDAAASLPRMKVGSGCPPGAGAASGRHVRWVPWQPVLGVGGLWARALGSRCLCPHEGSPGPPPCPTPVVLGKYKGGVRSVSVSPVACVARWPGGSLAPPVCGQNMCFVRGQGAWWPGALLVLLRAFLGLHLPPAPPEEDSG